jgi:hypothetical protein
VFPAYDAALAGPAGERVEAAAFENSPASGGPDAVLKALSAPLAIPTTAEQAGGQAVCLCIVSDGVNARFCLTTRSI